MATLPKLVDESNIDSFLAGIDNVMTDCDGVLWRLNELVEGADTVLNNLRKLGKKIFYVTNNSTKSRETLVQKLESLGFIAGKGEAISTSYIIAQHLKQIDFSKKVYVMGMSGITSELDLENIKYTGIGPDPVPESIFDLEKTVVLDPEVGCVVVGFDQHFNITKIMRAASYLINPECIFLATNRDERFPMKRTDLNFPGTGTFVKAVETASGRTAESVGKPSPRMFTVLQEKFDLDPSRTIMIGDRCSTDIMFGKNCGLQTLGVLTGINSWEDYESWAASDDPELWKLLPDYYIPSLGDLVQLLPN
ncbi:UNVERIFIED_CONTAM: hypothetical protein RMT77_005571 [Armadillidium vulgare]|nr:Glycerol-3-phosphate phosphatase [Armadillidium vulgare]